MRNLIKTHFEKPKHYAGPLKKGLVIRREDMPIKSGMSICGVLLDNQNQDRITREEVNCKECLNRLDTFK